MERILALVFLMCIGWICIAETAARSNDDSELLQQIISALSDGSKNDVRDMMNKKGTRNDVSGGNRNRYSGNYVKKGVYHKEDVKAVENGKTSRAHGHEKERDASFLRAIEAFLNSKRARGENEERWLQDDFIIRGTNATSTSTSTSTVVPLTNPATSSTAATTKSSSSSLFCFRFWGKKYCFRI
ncbi:uncharacterized protein LOC123547298 [Mercenaria mercenaria]|uniref:uncharacterized protein LOC123547298 n=1 Tax=Mercenaria mercenaria TaxID=6596 RepID=UPI00234F1102|nr:uncharacterized protein LOC123547298 [Mercenaria mercenaria]